jgi:hypothetical protein
MIYFSCKQVIPALSGTRDAISLMDMRASKILRVVGTALVAEPLDLTSKFDAQMRLETSFIVFEGLAGKHGVSLQSSSLPGHVIRTMDTSLVLASMADDTTAVAAVEFYAAATFVPHGACLHDCVLFFKCHVCESENTHTEID